VPRTRYSEYKHIKYSKTEIISYYFDY
jgi:hypothetical protein